jgi:D-amino-acid dehydrogenase
VVTDGGGKPPVGAVYLAEAKLGLSPFDDGVRIGGVLELGARGTTPPKHTAAKLIAASEPYLRGWRPAEGTVPEAWAGLRPTPGDGLPLIGPVPGHDDLFLAAGHTMLGVTFAPATAALLAPLVLHGERLPELAAFDPAR